MAGHQAKWDNQWRPKTRKCREVTSSFDGEDSVVINEGTEETKLCGCDKEFAS